MEKKLIETLKKADGLYYNDGMSWLSDDDYDALKDLAESIYPNDPYFSEVGAETETNKVTLPYVLGSLTKVDAEDVHKWLEKGRKDVTVTEKLDGVSVLVTYFRGNVVFASTRGDGFEGRDITEKASIFCPEIKEKGRFVLRGECVLKPDIKPQELGYKTRRNMVAGILNRDDNKHCDIVMPYFYELIEPNNLDFDSEYARITYIYISLGLPTPRCSQKNNPTGEELKNLYETYKSMNSNYDIDGLVLTRNDYIRENVKYPENKVKFKIHAKPILTKVNEIEWNTGRTGRIVPTILIDEVEIDGVKINRSTGFNAKFIRDNAISPGSEIMILRSGDVIPYITEVKKKEGDIGEIPETCPKCNEKVDWKGVDIVCCNDNCSETAIKRTEFFLRTMGVENITRKTLEKIGVSSILDAYEVDELEITNNAGIGLKKAEMIVDQVEKTLKTTPHMLLASFGIPNVGVELSKTICTEYDFDYLFEISEKELTKISGIGKVIAKKFVDNIGKYRDLYEALKEKGLTFQDVAKDSPVKGKTFTLTGSMPLKRDVVKRMIEENGGSVKNISKKIDYLVDANQDRETTKAKKAKQYGIPIISYEDLMAMING